MALRLAERIRALRQVTGLTQAKLAARAGVTVESVARMERVVRGRPSANANPSLDTLARIALAFSIDVSDLLAVGNRPRPRDDQLTAVLRGASQQTRQRVLRVAEALAREELSESKPARSRKRKKK